MSRTFPVVESISVPTGNYEGIIMKVEYRDEPYAYTDLIIEVKQGDKRPQLKVGFPSIIAQTSNLGVLLAKFKSFKIGDTIDPEQILVAQKVRFDVINSPGSKDKTRTFSNIVGSTITPLK